MVEQIIGNMHRGKGAGLDGLTAEHLIFCRSLLPCILAKLFNLFICYGHVPAAFGISYTVPLLKGSSSSYSKNLTTGDFRGISISPVMSKVFEHCVLRRFESYFVTSDNQFGFKKQSGCSHVIITVRSVINHYIAHGSMHCESVRCRYIQSLRSHEPFWFILYINGPFTTGKHFAIVGRLVCQMFHMCEMEFSNIMFLSVDTRNPAGWRVIAILVCGIC